MAACRSSRTPSIIPGRRISRPIVLRRECPPLPFLVAFQLSNEVVMMKTHRFASTVWNRLKQFAAHSGAAAATEFALIVPVLAGLVIAIDDYANVSVGTGEMQMASRSAIEYAMHGGTDM